VNRYLKKTNIVRDEWLEKILKKKVYNLVLDDIFIKKTNNKKSEEYKDFFKIINKKTVFIYSKISTLSISQIKFLEKWGFNLIDTNVVFEKKIILNKEKNKHKIRFAEQYDENIVKELARKSFKFSRFHLDEKIPNKIANEIKYKWVENYFKGKRGDRMVVAIIDNMVVGFLLLIKKMNSLIIDLIALDDKFRGKKIADDMIIYAENNIKNIKKIIVGTQIANIPSIRFYEKCGFHIIESNYVFHYHN